LGSVLVEYLQANQYQHQNFEGDINDELALKKAFEDFKPEIVIHLVGIVKEKPPQVTFDKIHVAGTQAVTAVAKDFEVKKIIYVSALGADPASPVPYYRTKGQAENIIKASEISYTILRPSLMFGKGAGFTNQLVEQMKKLPFIPILGKGESKFQIVAVDVTAECIAKAIELAVSDNKTYDIVGPETLTLEDITHRLAEQLKLSKHVVHLPLALLRFYANLERVGLPTAITGDQISMIQGGSEGDGSAMQADFSPPTIAFDPRGKYPLY